MRFVTPDGDVDAKAGDLMTVPPGAVHTFKNASETEDCECYMTATPGNLPSSPPCRSDRMANLGYANVVRLAGHYVDCKGLLCMSR